MMTLWTSSRDTLASFAMAAPMRCTSLAPMCFNTWAASCSPNVSNSIAARSVPERCASFLSIILGHPTAYDLRYPFRVLVDQRPGLQSLLFMSHGCLLSRTGQCRRVGIRLSRRSRQNLHLHLLCSGTDQILDQRANHRQHEKQQHHETAQNLGDVEEQG